MCYTGRCKYEDKNGQCIILCGEPEREDMLCKKEKVEINIDIDKEEFKKFLISFAKNVSKGS